MKTKHTTGKWQSVYSSPKDTEKDGQELHIVTYGNLHRTEKQGYGQATLTLAKIEVQKTWGYEHEEAEANAKLIAAAPKMLEALKYVIKWHREHDSGSGELFGLDYVTTCIAAKREAEEAK